MPSKILLANFIVRIYRFNEKNPRSIVGFVEEPGVKGKRAFTSFDELWEILTLSKAIKSKKGWKKFKRIEIFLGDDHQGRKEVKQISGKIIAVEKTWSK